MDSDSFLSFATFILIIILFLIVSIFSAFKIAVFSLSSLEKKELEESETPTGKKIKEILSKQEQLSETVFIWNTLICVAIVVFWFFAFCKIAIFPNFSAIGLIFHILCLSILIILFKKIVPAAIVKTNPLKFVRKTISFFKTIMLISSPVSNFLINYSKQNIRKTNDVSVEELSKALELDSDESSEEKDMLKGVIELYNKTAVEIMTSRMDMSAIDMDSGFQEVVQFVVEIGYSRIPVYSENQDDIRGILYCKDLLPYVNKQEEFRWQSLIRPAYFVPENKKIDELLEDFRKNKIHLAIVVDEFGGTSGLVTMEDILEEIVGEIDDEYDDEELKFSVDEGDYLFHAKTSLTDFFRITRIDPKSFGNLTEEVDTLAGLVLEIKGNFPEENETVSYESYSFQVLKMDKKRILKVKFTEQELPKNDEDE